MLREKSYTVIYQGTKLYLQKFGGGEILTQTKSLIPPPCPRHDKNKVFLSSSPRGRDRARLVTTRLITADITSPRLKPEIARAPGITSQSSNMAPPAPSSRKRVNAKEEAKTDEREFFQLSPLPLSIFIIFLLILYWVRYPFYDSCNSCSLLESGQELVENLAHNRCKNLCISRVR